MNKHGWEIVRDMANGLNDPIRKAELLASAESMRIEEGKAQNQLTG